MRIEAVTLQCRLLNSLKATQQRLALKGPDPAGVIEHHLSPGAKLVCRWLQMLRSGQVELAHSPEHLRVIVATARELACEDGLDMLSWGARLAAEIIGCLAPEQGELQQVAMSILSKVFGERKFIQSKPATVLRCFNALQSAMVLVQKGC